MVSTTFFSGYQSICHNMTILLDNVRYRIALGLMSSCVPEIASEALLTGSDHAGKHPGRGDGRGCVGRDGVCDLRLRRSRVVGRRAVHVIGTKLVIRHRLMIVIRVTAGAGT